MNDTVRIGETGKASTLGSADELLPIVYDELRRLAAQRLRHERPGQTIQATALVHEVFIRLVSGDKTPQWENRGHFFAAAAEAMRRILLNRARDKKRLKRRGHRAHVDLDTIQVALDTNDAQVLALDAAIEKLAVEDELCARLVKLRFFAGLSLRETAEAIGLSQRTAERQWAYARAWLYDELRRENHSRNR